MCWAKVCSWENLVRWCSWSASFTFFKGHTLTYVCNHRGDKWKVCQIFSCKDCHLCPLQLDVSVRWQCGTGNPSLFPWTGFFFFLFLFFWGIVLFIYSLRGHCFGQNPFWPKQKVAVWNSTGPVHMLLSSAVIWI